MTTLTTAPAFGGNGSNGKGAATKAAPGPNKKRCPQCEEYKDAAAFGPSDYSSDGLQSWCKACKRANYLAKRGPLVRVKQSPEARAAAERKSQRRYRESHAEEIKQRKAAYAAQNRETENARWRRYSARKQAEKPPRPSAAPQPKKERQKPAPVILPAEIQRHIDYFINAKAVREERTLKGYLAVLRLFGQSLGDKWPPDSDDINGFLARAKRRGCSDTTLFNYWRLLRNFFTWLHRRGKLAENPILLTEKPASPKKLPRAPKQDDLKRLFTQLKAEANTWPGFRNLALITLALDTGMREGELVKLTLADLDLEQCRIIVRETKTDRERFVVITPNTCQVLTDWQKARPVCDSERLFISRHRAGLTEWGVAQVLRKALRRAGANHFSMHALRHAYAIYSLKGGANLLDIQKQLGHVSISTTARYLLVADDDKRVSRHAQTSPVNGFLGGAL